MQLYYAWRAFKLWDRNVYILAFLTTVILVELATAWAQRILFGINGNSLITSDNKIVILFDIWVWSSLVAVSCCLPSLHNPEMD